MHPRKLGCEGVIWIQLAHDGVQRLAVVNTVMNCHLKMNPASRSYA
jgi:hypothetical protein